MKPIFSALAFDPRRIKSPSFSLLESSVTINKSPSANCLIAELKMKMYHYTGNQKYKDQAESMMNSIAKSASKFPTSFSSWLGAIMNNYYGIKEVSILGKDFQEATNKLIQNFIPSLILMSSQNPDKDFPLLNKPENSITMIYICENFACRSPMEINDDFINED